MPHVTITETNERTGEDESMRAFLDVDHMESPTVRHCIKHRLSYGLSLMAVFFITVLVLLVTFTIINYNKNELMGVRSVEDRFMQQVNNTRIEANMKYFSSIPHIAGECVSIGVKNDAIHSSVKTFLRS
jgi:hypothetical protein